MSENDLHLFGFLITIVGPIVFFVVCVVITLLGYLLDKNK